MAINSPQPPKEEGEHETPDVISAEGESFLRYGALDLDEVLADPAIDLVLISTRHDTHAELARWAEKQLARRNHEPRAKS